MLSRLAPKVIERIGRPSWALIRPKFEAIHAALIAVSETTCGESKGAYVKYVADIGGQPFAVVWLKKSTELLIGLALPESQCVDVGLQSTGITYRGLTAFLRLETGQSIPEQFGEWAQSAYLNCPSCPSGLPPHAAAL